MTSTPSGIVRPAGKFIVGTPAWLEACAEARERVAQALPENSRARPRILKIAAQERERARYLRARGAK